LLRTAGDEDDGHRTDVGPVILPLAGGGEPPDAVDAEGEADDLRSGVAGSETLGGEVGLGDRGLGPVHELEAAGLGPVGPDAVHAGAGFGFGALDDGQLRAAFGDRHRGHGRQGSLELPVADR
jgi:hypothetical protein